MSKTLEQADKLGEKVVEMLNSTVDSVPAAVERLLHFVEEQTPLFAHDVVAYGRAVGVFHLLLTAFFTWLVIFAWRKAYVNGFDSKVTRGECSFELVTSVVSSFPFVITTISLLCYSGDYLKAWFAPRLYLVDYITSLIKESK